MLSLPSSTTSPLADLRTRAQHQLAPHPVQTSSLTPAQTQALILELETHQLELEMQNEELLTAQQVAELAWETTERARAEYADLYEHAPVAYLTLTAAGTVGRANQRACRLLGLSADQLVGRRLLVFVAPGSRDLYAPWQAQVLAGWAPLSIEIEVLTEGGAPRLVQLEGVAGPAEAPARLALIDVTEQRQAAAALRHSQDQARLALAASGAGVIQWEGAASTVFLDEQARTLLGLPGPPAQLPLATLWPRVLPADRPALAAGLDRATAGQSLELEFRVGDAQAFRYLAAHCEMVFESGQRPRLTGLVRDVTERRAAQEEAAQLRLQQQQAVFKAVLATQEEERRRMSESLHNGVGQLLYLLKLTLEQDGAPTAAVSGLLDEAIRDLRAVSADLAPPMLEDFGLQRALETMGQRIPPPLRVRCNLRGLRPALPRPLETTIYRLVQELLNNVLKHARATEVFLHVVREGNTVDISVDDDGQGCCPQQPGTGGTGLASIRNQVTLLGGVLSVVSQPGHGTSVSIVLPVPQELAAPPADNGDLAVG